MKWFISLFVRSVIKFCDIMAERKSQQKWYPVDWDPSKGSVNKFQGSHPLRERAKKLDQGILVIRIEMPFNAWCLGCNAHIGMGVRYNAEKTKVGMYLSTPILQFRLKCHLCDNIMVLQTDPKNREYVLISGGRRKEQRWEAEENGQIAAMDKDEHFRLESDAMFRLEHTAEDTAKLVAAAPSFSEAVALQAERDRDDCEVNRALRTQLREFRKACSETTAGGAVPLLPTADADRKQASLIRAFSTRSSEKTKESSIAKAVALIRRKRDASSINSSIRSVGSSTKRLKLLTPISSKLVQLSTSTSTPSAKSNASPQDSDKPGHSSTGLVADYSSSDECD